MAELADFERLINQFCVSNAGFGVDFLDHFQKFHLLNFLVGVFVSQLVELVLKFDNFSGVLHDLDLEFMFNHHFLVHKLLVLVLNSLEFPLQVFVGANSRNFFQLR